MTTMTISRMPTVPAVAPKAEPLFKSAHAALVFALNYSMLQYDRPLMNRIGSGDLIAGMALGGGKGLAGLDGAGQAGMIRAELERLPPLHQAALVATFARQQIRCECRAACCSGWKVNREWSHAVGELTTVSASAALSGCVSNGRLRSALIQRLLGVKVTLADLAERHGVDEKTAGAHSAKLKRWLFGGGGDIGLHEHARRDLHQRLHACGLIDSHSEGG